MAELRPPSALTPSIFSHHMNLSLFYITTIAMKFIVLAQVFAAVTLVAASPNKSNLRKLPVDESPSFDEPELAYIGNALDDIDESLSL
jgi:hypothetical protein